MMQIQPRVAVESEEPRRLLRRGQRGGNREQDREERDGMSHDVYKTPPQTFQFGQGPAKRDGPRRLPARA
jgi:hypothetical protein